MSEIWNTLKQEAETVASKERILSKIVTEYVLERNSFADALSWRLSERLAKGLVPASDLKELLFSCFNDSPKILSDVGTDLHAVKDRDPACHDFISPFLYFKGFQALSAYRASNYLWNNDRKDIALYLQSLISIVYSVDIHPAATIGCGILLDHATGFVAGETTVIEDDVSILHEVTLGGTGKEGGDRHPKIKSGASIYASSTLLGNITVGENSVVAAGSLVLKDVEPNVTVAGIPAKIIS